jgi:hypothetical protein
MAVGSLLTCATATLTISPPIELLPFGIIEQLTQVHPTSF